MKIFVHSEQSEEPQYKRTFLLENQKVVYKNNSKRHDYKQSDIGTPDYTDLKLINIFQSLKLPIQCTVCGVTEDGIN
jgi:hypothetical protein